MSEQTPAARPVLWGPIGPPVSIATTARNSPKVNLPSAARQGQRLGSRFTDLDKAFTEQATLSASLGASDPQLVIVFESVDEREDLGDVATRAGLEILTEVDREFDPDPEFPRTSVDKDRPVMGCLHAVCVNEQARASILTQWRKWQSTGGVDRGYAALRQLFAHLKDVRAWGPQDRVRITDVAASLAGMLPGNHSIEIELWYRKTEGARQRAQAEVTALLQQGGGRVISSAQVPEVGYHGLKCEVSLDVLHRLATGDYNAIMAAKSAHVMYLRVTAQTHSFSEETPTAPPNSAPLPAGDPVLCVLDGVPVANHLLLADRISVLDPDDLGSYTSAETSLRQHGTAMASLCVWGDRSLASSPARRPVLGLPR